ncbi:glycosyltransferase family 8 protein [Morganella morganii]|uniref:glycosyltransferase family 8 protein n=1 Tax=Morganella morganii TaxID=582 RepID=UPI0031A63859
MYSCSIVKNRIDIDSHADGEPLLHIAFGVDENFIRPASIVILSILKANKNKKLKFHVFISKISNNSVRKLSELCADISIHVFDDARFKEMQERENLPISMYYRIIVPYILKDETEKVLYLDADLLCVCNIDDLINYTFKYDKLACVVNHKTIDEDNVNSLELKDKTHYFNSGVMLINTLPWVNVDILSLFSCKISSRDFKYPDQDVLNIILENRVVYISQVFNNFMEDVKSGDETVFIHFTGSPKPWQMWYEKSNIYDAFYNDSPWSDIAYDSPKTSRQMRIYSKKLSKAGMLKLSIYWKIKYFINKLSGK